MSNRKIRRIVSLVFFAPYLRQVLSINVHWLVADATIEKYQDVTNWSCIYNPAQKTILFNMRNDMSQIYKIDFNADFQ